MENGHYNQKFIKPRKRFVYDDNEPELSQMKNN